MKNQFSIALLFTFILIFSACGNKEKVKIQKELVALELTYEKDKSNAAALIAKLNEHVEKFPNDLDANARYMFRAGEVYFEQNDLDNAIAVLNKGIENYKEDDATPKSLQLLGNIYTRMNKLTERMMVFSQLIRDYQNHPAAKEVATIIPDEEALTKRMENLEQMLIDSSQSAIRTSILRELARAYQEYAIAKLEAKDANEKLLKAAQNYGAVGDFINATTILKSVIELNPKTDYAKDAMFEIAYLYGEMTRYDKAKSEEYINNSKKYYEMLIKDFPNDPLAEQSKMLMNNIGKSDEELLEKVIKKAEK